MIRYLDDFPTKLERIEFKTLEESKHSIYALSEKLNLIYVNPKWIHFAQENEINKTFLTESILGQPIIETFKGECIKNFYKENFLKVLKTGKPWRHEYECSSIHLFRKFHQNIYPIKNGRGLIIANNLSITIPMKHIGRIASDAIEKIYLNSDGFVTQCCNCRCTQRVEEPKIWDWVPKWIENIPNNFSHTICPICYDFYWKK